MINIMSIKTLEQCLWYTYRCGFLAVPVVNIIIGSLFLEHDIRVALIELAMEFRVLLNRLELLDSVDLERVLTRLIEEGLSLLLQLANVLIQVLTVETSVFVLCFNHAALY